MPLIIPFSTLDPSDFVLTSGAFYAPSVAPLTSLKKISLLDLRPQTCHRGQYLLVRAQYEANRGALLTTWVEDEFDNSEVVALYHQSQKQSMFTAISSGHVLLIKEPLYRVLIDEAMDKEIKSISVDHVSDVIRLFDHDERIPPSWQLRPSTNCKTAEEWKLEGNAALKIGDYHSAIAKYEAGLACAPNDSEICLLRLNCAHARLISGCFDGALQDASFILSKEPRNEKALFRAARALYELRRFEECLSLLDILAIEFPQNEIAQRERDRAIQRVQERSQATYDFDLLRKDVSYENPLVDCADFIGSVEIRQTKSQGRGLFLTRAVKPGELLFCEKAFAAAAEDQKLDPRFEARTGEKLLNRSFPEASSKYANIITIAVQKMFRNPSLISAFKELYRGSYSTTEEKMVEGCPIVDTFLVKTALSLNRFGYSISSREDHFKQLGDSDEADKPETQYMTGLWMLGSTLNHSCLPNTYRSFLGDLMIARAARDMPKDTELTFNYTSSLESYSERQKTFKNWGFTCVCPLCTAQQSESENPHQKRALLVEDIQTAFRQSALFDVPLDCSKIEKLLDTLDRTYTSPPDIYPRFASLDFLLSLMLEYRDEGRSLDVLRIGRRFLEASGFEVRFSMTQVRVLRWGFILDMTVVAFVYLWTACHEISPALGRQAEELARTVYEIEVGERGSFEEGYVDEMPEAEVEVGRVQEAFGRMGVQVG